MKFKFNCFEFLCVLCASAVLLASNVGAADVTIMRVPDGGIVPQVVSAGGVIHLVYFKGDASRGDLFYARSSDGVSFSSPMRVNSEAKSAIAVGAVRGAQLAIGKNGRVHVAWNAAGGGAMLYARTNDAGDAFEPQRNLAKEHKGVDGGGSVAADESGNVYVVWHAPEIKNGDEASRRVWMTRSSDGGKTFDAERAISQATGTCACCALKAFADERGARIIYRSATKMTHRDIYLLASSDRGETFAGEKLDEWEAKQCVMSTAAMSGSAMAWETRGQIILNRTAVPGEGENRKHPALATSSRGEMLLAWTEGTSWSKGGRVAWCLFDKSGKAIGKSEGRAEGLPVWGTAAVFGRGDGNFVVMY